MVSLRKNHNASPIRISPIVLGATGILIVPFQSSSVVRFNRSRAARCDASSAGITSFQLLGEGGSLVGSSWLSSVGSTTPWLSTSIHPRSSAFLDFGDGLRSARSGGYAFSTRSVV